jgi:hypothetical protein
VQEQEEHLGLRPLERLEEEEEELLDEVERIWVLSSLSRD